MMSNDIMKHTDTFLSYWRGITIAILKTAYTRQTKWPHQFIGLTTMSIMRYFF